MSAGIICGAHDNEAMHPPDQDRPAPPASGAPSLAARSGGAPSRGAPSPGGLRPIVLSMGDPCGIGPEIAARLFLDDATHPAPTDVAIVGDVGVMARAARSLGVLLPVARIDALADLPQVPPRCVPVLQVMGIAPDLAALPMGRVDARAGQAAAAAIEQATALVLRGEARALVTAPVHKEALAAAGVPWPGHTEMLQSLAAAGGPGGALPPVRMMLANDELRVVLVTIHMALRAALDALSVDGIAETIRITDRALRRMGMGAPRIAVAGVNPHAGEGGLFGNEEQVLVRPAIERVRAEGIDAGGPYPPDTVFMRARHAPGHPGAFDAVIAMTHDHGLIPVKYLGVEQGVNVTLGLPFVRTSPDHGTAFDIAGRGIADPASLRAALRMARALSAA